MVCVCHVQLHHPQRVIFIVTLSPFKINAPREFKKRNPIALQQKANNAVIYTIKNNCATSIKYFNNRSINASAESFNPKIKAFRGVRNVDFFIYRLVKLFA